MKARKTTMVPARTLAFLVFAGAWAAIPRAAVAAEAREPTRTAAVVGPAAPAERASGTRRKLRSITGPPARIQIAFKLDPRLTRSLYMGDRWVSPPTFTSTHPRGKEIALTARARVVDARARPVPVAPRWTPSEPDALAVSSSHGDEVEIRVRRAGRTGLRLEYGPIVKDLVIEAVERDGFWRVDVSQ